MNTDQGTGGSELEYDIEAVWVGTSTDGFILPVSRHPFDPDSSGSKVEKTGSYTCSLNGLNKEAHREYRFFVEVNSKDSGKRAEGGSTFTAFFRIGPSEESQTGEGRAVSNACCCQSDETEWWVQCSDGTYLSSQWYCSPKSGLWYYLEEDKDMMTDAAAPTVIWLTLTESGYNKPLLLR